MLECLVKKPTLGACSAQGYSKSYGEEAIFSDSIPNSWWTF